MKIQSKVFKIAHQIKSYFATWSETLRAAWHIVKLFLGRITSLKFAKISTGEVRVSNAPNISLNSLKNGCIKFTEINEDGAIQYRSFRVETLILN
jgi:hypothetical protein